MKKIKRIGLIFVFCVSAMVVLGITALLCAHFLFPFPTERIAEKMAIAPVLVRADESSLITWRMDRNGNRRLRTSLAGISPRLVDATIAVKDQRFRSHPGVDAVAISRAILQNLAARRRVSGASTITMQTIRLLWDRPRTWHSKIIEAFRALQLEGVVDKNTILEIYLNLAPYGGNVVGAEAAARFYFGKSATQLTLPEAALLAGLPQSPTRLNPVRHPDAALRRRNVVLHRLFVDGKIDIVQTRRAMREPLRLAGRERTAEAPHFAELALRAATTPTGTVATTLDPEIQASAMRLAKAHAARNLAPKNVAGPAIVVLSAADSSVLAYIGNASPASAPARQVDAVLAARQPGSLMKPFIFARLAERGGVALTTRTYDLPQAWSDYSPRNMDRLWRGEMNAAEALRESRNVTAVRQLAGLGVDAFARFMRDLGLREGRTDRDGLALALGVKEQTLLDIANAYAALARLGDWRPARYLADQPPAAERRVLSPAAAWLTLAALAPPGAGKPPKIAWKTGTSWNQLDAWAIAMSPELVVGVWCGRLGRGGRAWVSGAEDALPLALDILDAVRTDSEAAWEAPVGIEFVQVCHESGLLPGWACRDVTTSPVLSFAGALSRCRLHREKETGSETAVKESAAGDEREKKPDAIRVLHPSPGAEYLAEAGATRLPFQAESKRGGELHWFVNSVLAGKTQSGEVLEYAAQAGNYRVSVTDGRGNTEHRSFRITAGILDSGSREESASVHAGEKVLVRDGAEEPEPLEELSR